MTSHTLPGEHQSLWLATTPRSDYPSLSQDLRVDVAVVGGGLAGLTTALLLKQRGKRVAVLEAGRVAEHVTAYTTAKLTSQHSLIYDYLIRSFGEEKAFAYATANEQAIGFVAQVAATHGIECEFTRTPAYVYAEKDGTEKDGEVEQLEAEVKAAQKVGLPADLVTTTPLPFPVAAALRFANQAYFHPRKYLLGLARLIPGEGSYILEHTQARDLEEGTPCRVTTDHGVVTADDVVMASHFPFYDNGRYFARLSAEQSYLMAVTLDGPAPEGMYISVDSSRTLRRHVTAEKRELLLVGGEGHKTGQGGETAERYARIEAWARQHFPVKEVLYSWTTQDFTPMDRVPMIGYSNADSQHVYVATGFKKWGMTTGTVAGQILTDLITGQANPWAAVFDPNRTALAGVGTLIAQNLQVAKEFVTGHLPSSVDKDIPRGEGRIIEEEDGKTAYYRADDGTLHRLSPVCPHMGCIVNWNPAEKSWDCPCHGSRFSATGEVIYGPALSSLKAKTPDPARSKSG